MSNESNQGLEKMLKSIPGARRAAQGIIIPTGDGGFFHMAGSFDKEMTEGLSNDEVFYLTFCSKNEILRLRSLRIAHDYLLRLRAIAIVDDARACRVFRKRRHAQHDWALTTYYHSKDTPKKEYLEHLTRSNAKILRGMPAGLGYVRQVNALCVRSFLGDVVFISEALESFYYFMNLAFADAKWQIADSDRTVALAIAVRIMLGNESLDFDLDSRGELPLTLERELRLKTKDQLAFTYGHEYAHHLCNHLSSANSTALRMSAHDLNTHEQVATYSHEIEHEADLYSLINIRTNPDYQNRITAAAFSVFLFLDFLDPYLKMFSTGSNDLLKTHPLPIERLWRLREKIKPSIGPSKGDIDQALANANVCHGMLKSALAEKGPHILEFYGSIYLPNFKSKPGVDRIDF